MNRIMHVIHVIAMTMILSVQSAYAEDCAFDIILNGANIDVHVPKGVLNNSSKLYLVWDSADKGKNIGNWPADNRVEYSGTITDSEATYSFARSSVPEGACARVIASPAVSLIDGYVNVGKNQYVDTGVGANSAYGIDIKFDPIGQTSAYGSIISGWRDDFTIGFDNENLRKIYLRYRGIAVHDVKNAKPAGNSLDIGESGPVTYRIFNKREYTNSVEVTTRDNEFQDGPMGTDKDYNSILLGASWNTTGFEYRQGYANWYYVKILDEDGDELVDLVPALRGDSTLPDEVFFWDRVTKKCIGNSGTSTSMLAYSGNVTDVVSVSRCFANTKTAYWTGQGDRSNVNDPANWNCTDATGAVVSSAPTADMTVVIKGETNFNMPTGQVLTCYSLDTGAITLTDDCDWSGLKVSRIDTHYTDVPNKAYVDTGFKPNQDTRVVMDVTVQGAREYWFGAWNINYKGGAYAVGNDLKSIYTGYGDSGGPAVSSVVSNGRHTIDFYEGSLTVDGETLHTRAAGDFQVNYNLYLFAQNRQESMYTYDDQGTIRCHSCKIYDNGTLVRHYVSATVDGVAGFWEKCSGKFIGSANSTVAFSAGPVRGGVVATDGSLPTNVDLAGHKLTLGDNIAEMSCTVTDTIDGGELHVGIDEGAVAKSGVALTGSLKLVKEGAGSLVGARADQTYTGGTLVDDGMIRSGVFRGAWGPDKAQVTIAEGAGFDFNGFVNETSLSHNFTVCGTGPDGNGAIRNGSITYKEGVWWNANQIADMELTGNAFLKSEGNDKSASMLGFCYKGDGNTPHILTMNGHTLRLSVFDRFAFRCVKTVGSGTIVVTPNNEPPVNENVSQLHQVSFYTEASDLSSVALDIAEGVALNVEKAFPVGTFIDRRTKAGTGKTGLVTVLDTYRPMTANLFANIQLGDQAHPAPVLDLSGLDAPFVLPASTFALTAAEGATVQLVMGQRKIDVDTPVITWTKKPEGLDSITFTCGDPTRRYGVSVCDDGVYLTASFVLIIR